MPHVDILVFAPHPDDAELCCGGLLLLAGRAGLKLGVIDITQGEMGTRGSVAERKREAAAATKLLKLSARENLKLPDGKLHDDQTLRCALVRMLRRYRPAILLAPHWEDQHPDHAAVGQASLYAAWLCGAPNYDAGSGAGIAAPGRPPYRPRHVLHYNNRYGIQANVIFDISSVMDEKIELVRCYATQFGAGDGSGKQTRLSDAHFFDWLRGMHAFYGYQAGARFGEPYCTKTPLAIGDIGLLAGASTKRE
ncbi:MAG TPA: bacillithiol biosynthesis deacetylase BshB1 [Planctomycetota bacterium]|nr:bacillithiol biosynthesis deacetylase BshB1 [Planctomycetota bacterium]